MAVERFGVFDLGTARFKLTVGTRSDGRTVIERLQIETGADLQEFRARGGGGYSLSLRDAAETLASEAALRRCQATVAYATAAFREDPTLGALVDHITPILGPVTILTEGQEGALLYAGIEGRVSSSHPVLVCDIGGGSVQLAWGRTVGSSVSFPIGTFALERRFHLNREPSRADLDEIESFVERAIRSGWSCHHYDELVVGSNQMASFFRAALKRGDIPYSECPMGVCFGKEGLEELFSLIAARPYELLGSYFPENPGFMRGADKLLLVARAVATMAASKSIIATNDSVSSAICEAALRGVDPAELRLTPRYLA